MSPSVATTVVITVPMGVSSPCVTWYGLVAKVGVSSFTSEMKNLIVFYGNFTSKVIFYMPRKQTLIHGTAKLISPSDGHTSEISINSS